MQLLPYQAFNRETLSSFSRLKAAAAPRRRLALAHRLCRHITLWEENREDDKGQDEAKAVGWGRPAGKDTFLQLNLSSTLVFPCSPRFPPSFPSCFLPTQIWTSFSAESHSVVYFVNNKLKHLSPAKSPKIKQKNCPPLDRGGCYFGSQFSQHNVVLSSETQTAAWQLSPSALREWAH